MISNKQLPECPPPRDRVLPLGLDIKSKRIRRSTASAIKQDIKEEDEKEIEHAIIRQEIKEEKGEVDYADGCPNNYFEDAIQRKDNEIAELKAHIAELARIEEGEMSILEAAAMELQQFILHKVLMTSES